MIRFLKFFAAAILGAALLSACDRVPAGHVGVKVYLLGGEKGVDSEVLPVGRYWIGINEELYLYPTFMQNAEWTADVRPGSEDDESLTFQTKEGMRVNADVGLSYTLNPDKISEIFQTYRRGVDEITDTFVRNMIQDALNREASKLSVEEIYGAGKNRLIEAVYDSVSSQVNSKGIVINKIYWIGDVRVPTKVTESINAKIEATQRSQQRANEVAEARAEADKQVAKAEGEARAVTAIAQAQADSNRKIAESITPELIEYMKTQKWDGRLPQVQGDVTPMLDLRK